MDFTNFDLGEFFGIGDDFLSEMMMLIWILPIIIFVFYGQRIQLMVSSNEIKKDISKLEEFKNDSRQKLIDYVKNTLNPKDDPVKKIDSFGVTINKDGQDRYYQVYGSSSGNSIQ